MAKNDAGLVQLSDVIGAVALLTRLPVPAGDTARGGAAAWAYPLVGLLVGGISAAFGMVGLWLGLPGIAVALLCVASMMALTGALHEDGLADTADGLWGGWTPDARLEIMKDSHIGTYGVLALILATLARTAALWLAFEVSAGTALIALLVSGALSRATMPALMSLLPHARDTGLSHSVGGVDPVTAAIAWAIAGGTAIVLAGMAGLWAVFFAAAVMWGMGTLARRKIGGQTGDILGATQQLSEIAVLYCLLA